MDSSVRVFHPFLCFIILEIKFDPQVSKLIWRLQKSMVEWNRERERGNKMKIGKRIHCRMLLTQVKQSLFNISNSTLFPSIELQDSKCICAIGKQQQQPALGALIDRGGEQHHVMTELQWESGSPISFIHMQLLFTTYSFLGPRFQENLTQLLLLSSTKQNPFRTWTRDFRTRGKLNFLSPFMQHFATLPGNFVLRNRA